MRRSEGSDKIRDLRLDVCLSCSHVQLATRWSRQVAVVGTNARFLSCLDDSHMHLLPTEFVL